jgi:hypothetical protein
MPSAGISKTGIIDLPVLALLALLEWVGLLELVLAAEAQVTPS